MIRTRIGPFLREEAHDLSKLLPESIPGLLRPALEAAAGLPALALSAEQVAAVVQGRALTKAMLAPFPIADGEIALVGPRGDLVAIAAGDPQSGLVWPRRVLFGA